MFLLLVLCISTKTQAKSNDGKVHNLLSVSVIFRACLSWEFQIWQQSKKMDIKESEQTQMHKVVWVDCGLTIKCKHTHTGYPHNWLNHLRSGWEIERDDTGPDWQAKSGCVSWWAPNTRTNNKKLYILLLLVIRFLSLELLSGCIRKAHLAPQDKHSQPSTSSKWMNCSMR